MDFKHIAANLELKEVQQSFIDDVRPKYIMPTLRQLKVISDEEEKEIKASLSREDEVRKLIDFMLEKRYLEEPMKNFVRALRVDENGDSPYPWFADALERKNELSPEGHKTLVNGNIPFPIYHFLDRKTKDGSLLEKIRNKLRESKRDRTAWVTICGPIGSGKTVLAAEAVRDDELIEKTFPGGIFWLYFSYFEKNESPEIEADKIKEQMKTLFMWMQSDVELPYDESIQSLKYCLRKAIVKRGKTLIVLDDVGSQKVINAFDIGCTVLVTTIKRLVMSSFEPEPSYIECNYDLEEHDIMSLISAFTKIPSDRMKDIDIARDICKKCGGSPLMTTLIALRLADIGPDFKLWKEFDQKLNVKGMNTVVRHRNKSGDYNHDLETLVRYSLDSMGDKKYYFYDFLVFAKDVPVPSEVLEVLWDLKSLDVKDIMIELHYRCFVEKVKTEESESPSYRAHYLDIVKKDKDQDWLKERHKTLMRKLPISSSGDIDLTLFSKNYIHLALCYHLNEAGEYELLENVCLNLRFVEQKIHWCGDPESLFMDYHLYKDKFKHPEHVKQFEEFIHKNASSICKKVDIFQLALFEPTSSIVYQKAYSAVSSLSSGYYYDWSNKRDSELYFKCKIGDIEEGKEIAHGSCNSDCSLVAIAVDTHGEVYQSATGEELMILVGHADKVTYCAFNTKGDKICTASKDTTVKIYIIDESMITSYGKRRMSRDEVKLKDNSYFTFTKHKAEVSSCNFSPDDQLIISCDDYGVILVWEYPSYTSPVFLKNASPITLRQVKWGRSFSSQDSLVSYFSHDSSMFGAYSKDCFKVWKIEAPFFEETPFMTHNFESDICGFCFSEDNDSAFVALSNNIYKWKNGQILQSVLEESITKDYSITCCCLSPDGNFLAYGTSPPSIVIVNVHSLHVVAYFQGHNVTVKHAAFSKDGTRLLSVSDNRRMIHDLSNLKDKPIANFAKNLSVRLSPDESIFVASSNYFNRIEVRKGYEGALLATTENVEDCDITACSLSYDCKEVVYGNIKGSVKVFNIDDKSVSCLQKHVDRVTFILHSKANPPCFFTCSEDRTIRVWKERDAPLTLKKHTDSVLMCAEFKKGDRILSCSKDGTMKVWNIETGEVLVPLDNGHGNLDVRFCDISSPYEDLVASASSDETVRIWRSGSGESMRVFKEKDCNASVKCCRFMERGQVLVSGHDNGKVKLWSLAEKLPLVLPEKHDSAVHNILCDGKRILTLSNDIKLWDYNMPLKTIVLPSSSMGYAPPNVWASGGFKDIVVILNSVLYILRRIN